MACCGVKTDCLYLPKIIVQGPHPVHRAIFSCKRLKPYIRKKIKKRGKDLGRERVLNGKVRFPKGYWRKKENRIKATKAFVNKFNRPLTSISMKDFVENNLATLILYHKGSPYLALKEAGCKLPPWSFLHVPRHYWDLKGNRIRATKWLIEKTGKSPEKITRKDFRRHRLLTIPNMLGSHKLALIEAGCKNVRWVKRDCKPMGYWKNKDNRISEIRKLIDSKCSGDYRRITRRIIIEGNLSSIYEYYPGSSVWKMLKDAGYPINLNNLKKCGIMRVPKKYWDNKKHRATATRMLVHKLNKNPEEITNMDFYDNNLSGLVNRCGGSSYQALLEAGYNINPWERRYVPKKFWSYKKNRVLAIKWLVCKLGKEPCNITHADFLNNGLSGLYSSKYYNCSRYAALKEAGFDIDVRKSKKNVRIRKNK